MRAELCSVLGHLSAYSTNDVARYGADLDLTRCISRADDVLPRLRRQIGELQSALQSENQRIAEKDRRHEWHEQKERDAFHNRTAGGGGGGGGGGGSGREECFFCKKSDGNCFHCKN